MMRSSCAYWSGTAEHRQLRSTCARPKQRWTRTRISRVCQSTKSVNYLDSAENDTEKITTSVAIIGSGPAAHTAAIYLARAELEPVLFEGWMANGIAPGGQLTTTSYVENFPGFPSPILGSELCENFRMQSVYHGTVIHTETVTRVQLDQSPFKLYTDTKEVEAQAIIIATGAVARRLRIPGAGEAPDGYWQRGVSACAVCDGGSPMLRNQAVAVVGGGDVAMEEATFLCRYASKVYVVHRFNYLEASKVLQRKAFTNPKIEILWEHEVLEAVGDREGLTGIVVQDNRTGVSRTLPIRGLFFGIGHTPATKFLEGQVALDHEGYIITDPDSTATSVPGVFAAGDVQDKKWRQAITSAGTGCMAALEAERYLQHKQSQEQGIAIDITGSSHSYEPPVAREGPAGKVAV